VLSAETQPVLGTTWRARVDLVSGQRAHALLFAYLHADERPLGGSVLLGRDLVAVFPETQPGRIEVPLPPEPSLIGIPLVTQALVWGRRPGAELTNALDLVLGLE